MNVAVTLWPARNSRSSWFFSTPKTRTPVGATADAMPMHIIMPAMYISSIS